MPDIQQSVYSVEEKGEHGVYELREFVIGSVVYSTISLMQGRRWPSASDPFEDMCSEASETTWF